MDFKNTPLYADNCSNKLFLEGMPWSVLHSCNNNWVSHKYRSSGSGGWDVQDPEAAFGNRFPAAL